MIFSLIFFAFFRILLWREKFFRTCFCILSVREGCNFVGLDCVRSLQKPISQARALSMGHFGPCPPPFSKCPPPPPYFWKYLIKILQNAVKVALWPWNSHFWGQNRLNIAKFRWFLGLRPRPRLFFRNFGGTLTIWPKVAPPPYFGGGARPCNKLLIFSAWRGARVSLKLLPPPSEILGTRLNTHHAQTHAKQFRPHWLDNS